MRTIPPRASERRFMTSPKLALLSAAVVAALVAGCGGGGSGSSAPAPAPVVQSAVSTYITDNLATEYSKVWAGILDITLVDAAGQKAVLFHSDTPTVYNLSSLASVAELLSSATIPQGTYVRALVTLDDKVQLVSLDGLTTINATLKGDGSPTIVPVELEFHSGTESQLVLDFDLAKFTYDATTNRVVPTVTKSPKTGGSTKDFQVTRAKTKGLVSEVGADGLTLTDKHLGTSVRVRVTGTSVILNENTGAVLALSDIKPGYRVDARGVVASEHPPVLTAATVRVKTSGSGDDDRPSAVGGVHGEGTVSAVTNTSITVDLKEANFLPGANKVVLDISNAKYARGVAGDLKVGVKVSFAGTLTDAAVVATFLNIDGALSERERVENPEARAGEIRGVVASVAGAVAQVKLTRVEYRTGTGTATLKAGDTVPVNMANAVFERGALACVVAGKEMEAAGRLGTNNEVVAQVIELEHGCDAPTVGGSDDSGRTGTSGSDDSGKTGTSGSDDGPNHR